MNGAKVIGAITNALATSIAEVVRIDKVDLLAPQEAEKAGSVLNLWLYQVLPNPSRMGLEPSWKRSDARVAPPLAVSLRYLLTTKTDDVAGHNYLGQAMLHLHEKPEIRLDHPETVRVTLLPLALDELEKIWAGTQAPRRLSVAYNVDVVVLEGEKPASTPLPVLHRNIVATPMASPTIDRLVITSENRNDPLDRRLALAQRGRMAAQLGNTLRLGTNVIAAKAIIKSVLHKSEIEIRPAGGDPFPLEDGYVSIVLNEKTAFAVPDGEPARFIAGPNTICLEPVQSPDGRPVLRTNEVPFMLAPKVVSGNVAADRTITLTSTPPPRPKQSIALIVGGLMVNGQVEKEGMAFTIPPLDARTKFHPIRLRIDGADSTLTPILNYPKPPSEEVPAGSPETGSEPLPEWDQPPGGFEPFISTLGADLDLHLGGDEIPEAQAELGKPEQPPANDAGEIK